MIYRFKYTKQDKEKYDILNVDPESLINDNYDYSHEIIQKPWGYEYQILNNGEIAIWILHINGGQQTSFHSHPNKTTILTVLDKIVTCNGSWFVKDLYKGDMILIDKGVFHQTTALMHGAIVMEIETPANKNDLVRFKDIYGRV